MPVPKRKRSKRRRDSRFANKGMHVQSITGCRNCQAPISTHQACTSCGYYKGVKMLATKAERSEKRATLKQARSSKTESASQNDNQE
jgi:large subunit ribosomal protein L32